MRPFILLWLFVAVAPLLGEEARSYPSMSEGSVVIAGEEVAYRARTGKIAIKGEGGKERATLFYVAYERVLTEKEELRRRPITFCFNGGPGAAAVWLHLGAFGPKRVAFETTSLSLPPYRLISNPYSLLDITDLVFVDPVSTGYSRAASDEDPKAFHGVDEDVEAVGEWIRRYIGEYGRWESPKFLMGESYGTTRAVALAAHLHKAHHLYLNGVILISSALNFATLHDSYGGNDLPYPLFLPSYAAAAWYHKRLSLPLQGELVPLLKEVEEFAMGEYASALLRGNELAPERQRAVAEKVARYTGLPLEEVLRAELRIPPLAFTGLLLEPEGKRIGRFDARYQGIDPEFARGGSFFDPFLGSLFGLFTATFNEYVRGVLGWQEEEEYLLLGDVRPWRFRDASDQCLTVTADLRYVMSHNPALRVFVASGLYDLATPYLATAYTFAHLGGSPSLKERIRLKNYSGGHMMFMDLLILGEMRKDLVDFIGGSLKGEGA